MLLKQIQQGESLTIGVKYLTDTLEKIKFFLGGTEMTATKVGDYYRIELSSAVTRYLSGKVPFIVVIDDTAFGIRKTEYLDDYIIVDRSTDKFSDSSINTGFDVEVIVTIDTDVIITDIQLIEAIKGDKGDVGSVGYVQFAVNSDMELIMTTNDAAAAFSIVDGCLIINEI